MRYEMGRRHGGVICGKGGTIGQRMRQEGRSVDMFERSM